MQSDRGPQGGADKAIGQTGIRQHHHRGDVVEQHAGQQSPRGGAVRRAARHPAGQPQRSQACSTDAGDRPGGVSGERFAEQDRTDQIGTNEKGHAGAEFNRGRRRKQVLHGESSENEEDMTKHDSEVYQFRMRVFLGPFGGILSGNVDVPSARAIGF